MLVLTTGFGQNLLKNGTFDGNPSSKDWNIEVTQVANQQTGGNPGGWIWLNHNGSSTDPSASQGVSGLKPGTIYRITGDYKGGTNVHLNYENKAANAFSIDIDGNSVKKMPLPQDLYKWTRFEATFTATKTSHTLKFRGEIDGTDGDVALDNVVMVPVSKEIQLLSGGSEGIRTNSEISAGKDIKLEVLFVDFEDQPLTTTNFDDLWNTITSKGELQKAFERQGAKVSVNLNKTWKRMPKKLSEYFPPATDAGDWLWQDYTDNSIKLLGAGTDFTSNTIVVVVPNKGATGFKSVASGAHGASFRGVRQMITLMPQIYNEHYTTLMHEIGHCLGSDELYPMSQEPVPGKPGETAYMHEVGGYDLMGDVVYATGFMGWHRFRYGWLPGERAQSLTTAGDIQIDLKKLSGTSGTAMIAVPDKTKAAKLWVIEIGQDVASRDQFVAGKGEKLNKEGDRIIVYTVENPEVSGKRAIRLSPRTNFSPGHGTVNWLDDVSYKETAGFKDFNKADAPFSFTVDKKVTDGFSLTVKVK